VVHVAAIYTDSVRDGVRAGEWEMLPTTQRLVAIERMMDYTREASWLHFLLKGPEDRGRALGEAIDKLLSSSLDVGTGDDGELRLELEICRAALYQKHLDDLSCDNVRFANASVARVILGRDGKEVAQLVDTELRELPPLVRRLTEGKRELFLDRAKVFRAWGWGFLFTGVRSLAEAVGCRVPPAAADTLVFYL
jgi:hypothetical protein